MITKTINPLHFEDLEPHRFEDLVRQIVYDFRDWGSLEATGRLGSDEGFDARGWEYIYIQREDDDNEPEENIIKSNLWLIQCKREQTITPSKMSKYLDEILLSKEKIYGIIFSAACDFSKKTRDLFITRIRAHGIQEFILLGKAEIEDLIFQPKYDHLLFAYFGISLQIRKRSIKTLIRAKISTKKKIEKLFGLMKNELSFNNPILLRNPEDEHYPYSSELKNFDGNPQWRVYKLVRLEPDGILVMSRKYLAYYDSKEKTYDCINKYNIDDTCDNRWPVKNPEEITEKEIFSYWDKLPDENKYYLEVIRIVYFDRILAIDENGDHYFNGPHIFVEWNKKWGPFDSSVYLRLNKNYGSPENVSVNSLKRIKKFPKHLREVI